MLGQWEQTLQAVVLDGAFSHPKCRTISISSRPTEQSSCSAELLDGSGVEDWSALTRAPSRVETAGVERLFRETWNAASPPLTETAISNCKQCPRTGNTEAGQDIASRVNGVPASSIPMGASVRLFVAAGVAVEVRRGMSLAQAVSCASNFEMSRSCKTVGNGQEI